MSDKDAEIQIGIARPKLPEVLLNTTYSPVFPFLRLRLQETNHSEADTNSVTVKLHPKLFKLFVEFFGTDSVIQYFDLRSGKLDVWTRDMLIALRMMQKLGLMSEMEEWLKVGHTTMIALISGENPQFRRERSASRLATAMRILEAAGLQQEVDNNPTLAGVIEDAAESERRDRDTLIYRAAMAVYHSKRISGEAAVPSIENAGAIYLALFKNLKNTGISQHLLAELKNTQAELRPDLVKVFMCFVITSYLLDKEA